MKKLTLKFIKQKTKEIAEGYSCNAEKYINNRIKLPFTCNENHYFEMTWHNFSSGWRCIICANKKRGKSRRHTIEYIKQKTKKWAKGYKCLVTKYKNSQIKISFKCDKSHDFLMSWACFQQGQRCPICYKESNKKEDNPNWRGGVTEKNISLYNTYAHQISFCEKVRKDPKNKEHLQVKCTNSNCRKWFSPTRNEVNNRIFALFNIRGVNNFYCSKECKQSCSIFRQQMYPKGFIPETYGRSSQKEWANMVKERDKYICQKCGKEGKIAHHIEGLNINPLMSADISIGITFCKECDKKVHSEIGCRPIDLTKNKICEGRF